jgi:phage repressor protein C with HTH and peptisase S24 domain
MEANNNDFVVLKTIDEEVLFKQLKKPTKGEDLFQFVSLNPHHAPLFLRADQIYKISPVHSVIRPLKEKLRALTVHV